MQARATAAGGPAPVPALQHHPVRTDNDDKQRQQDPGERHVGGAWDVARPWCAHRRRRRRWRALGCCPVASRPRVGSTMLDEVAPDGLTACTGDAGAGPTLEAHCCDACTPHDSCTACRRLQSTGLSRQRRGGPALPMHCRASLLLNVGSNREPVC